MLTDPKLKSQVDRLWDMLWTGGLTNPMGADVILALHSHGPKRRGQDLVAQIGSYTGGCDLFLGPDGFAAGPADVPVNDGECSTISLASHQGN